MNTEPRHITYQDALERGHQARAEALRAAISAVRLFLAARARKDAAA